MSRSSPTYNKFYTRTFKRHLKQLEKKSRIRYNRVEEAVDNIMENPQRNVEFGKGKYRGKRKWRIGDDRLLFVVCKQCRELEHQKYNQCDDCENTPDETIKFVSIVEGHRY